LLFKEGVIKLSTWMHQNDRIDPELTYWTEKTLFLGTRSFASLVTEGGFGSQDVWLAAGRQDLIGRTKLLHGKLFVEIASIQQLHCMSSLSCRLTGKDWMKVFTSLLIQISHSQWIFRNYSMCDKQRGYLRLWLCSEVLHEILELLETAPSDVPPESQYLLELDHSTLYNASYEEQAYWVLALKAARRAGQRKVVQRKGWGRSKRNRIISTVARRIWYDFSALVGQMRYELCQPATTRKRQYSTSVSASIASNKRLRKLRWSCILNLFPVR
jgi:hypothetical protein